MDIIAYLIEKYTNLEYEDGYFYEDKDSEGYLVDDDMKPLDAHSYIEEFFHGESITLPNSGDPREDREQVMTGKEYIAYMFNDDYSLAFQYIHPKNGVKLPKGQVDKEEAFQFLEKGELLNKSTTESVTVKLTKDNYYAAGIDPYCNDIVTEGSVAVLFREGTGENKGKMIAEYLGREKKEFEIPFHDLIKDMLKYYPTNIKKERTDEDVMMELKAIKMFKPHVLKDFIDNHYGKENPKS